jgi:hypothetical protein
MQLSPSLLSFPTVFSLFYSLLAIPLTPSPRRKRVGVRGDELVTRFSYSLFAIKFARSAVLTL